MAGLKQSLVELLQSSRTRVILIVTAVLLIIIGITVYLMYDSDIPGPVSSSALRNAPDVRSVPGGFDNASTAEYVKLQEQQNLTQATTAESRGTSAIPTITSSSKFSAGQPLCPCTPDNTGASGLSFSSLKKLEDNDLTSFKSGGIGIVYADGTIHDATGNILATIGSDGLTRDASGNVVDNLNNSAGKLVYDANGKLLGTVGADGLVRDANGNVIGQVGADGMVRDKNGKILGKVSAKAMSGAKVYDDNGKLLGTVGPDGMVRDANGNVIGQVGADGILHDKNGKILGKVGTDAFNGAKVYDANGKLLGTVGPDGLVRDANGNVIGKVGPDGQVYDLNGKLLGKVATTTNAIPVAPAAPASDAATDATPAAAVLPSNSLAASNIDAAAMQAAMQRQALLISDQRAQQLSQQLQSAMTTQANQLFTAWTAPSQQFVAGVADKDLGGDGSGTGGAAGRITTNPKAFIKAGTIIFAVLDTAINSDEPGPVMATVVEGQFKGAKLIGAITRQDKKVLISFDKFNLPNASSIVRINAVAVDPQTARTALSSETDSHYLLRYGSLFAASFFQGYAQALTQSGAVVSQSATGTVSTFPDLSPKQKIFVGLGNVGNRYSSVLNDVFNTPPTVKVNSGVGIGVLFTDDVNNKAAPATSTK